MKFITAKNCINKNLFDNNKDMIGVINLEVLKASERQKNVNHHAKKERRKGLVPGILYGKNTENILFEIADLDLEKEVLENGENGILDISINGNTHKTLIKEVQKDSVNHRILHIDLEELSRDTKCISEIPLIFNGENNALRKGGILQKSKNKVKVKCAAEQLPKSIEVNVSNMNIGDCFRISDVEIAKEITVLDGEDNIIASLIKANGADIPDPDIINEDEKSQ